jgi:hypothetical protein
VIKLIQYTSARVSHAILNQSLLYFSEGITDIKKTKLKNSLDVWTIHASFYSSKLGIPNIMG